MASAPGPSAGQPGRDDAPDPGDPATEPGGHQDAPTAPGTDPQTDAGPTVRGSGEPAGDQAPEILDDTGNGDYALQTKPFDPEPGRERMRGALAIVAFVLLFIIVITILYGVVVKRMPWDDLEGLTTALLPAATSIVGSIVGFFFGSETKR